MKTETKDTHELLWEATEAGFAVAGKKGSTSSAVYRAMVEKLGIDPNTNSTGRMGHGLGLQLTELFSNNATDEQPLTPGVEMTLEPGMLVIGSETLMIVHEEDIVITENGAEWLSDRAPKKMVSILDGDVDSAMKVYEMFEESALKRLSVK